MSDQLDMAKLLDITELPGLEGEEIAPYEPLVLVPVESNPQNRTPDLEDDYTVVRKNMHFQSQMLMDAAKIFLETAKNADSPRHMEVFSTLMGQMTATNKELLKMHKEMKEITNEATNTNKAGQSQPGMNIQNATVFVGSPTDMMDEFGDAYEAQEEREKIINGTTS
ncbi:terminus DNA packaging enzyme, small subunit [Serratia phage X20]|uniref:Terminus DNA packaging enzyme, small subunit n=3 Tax=Winklervirus TaxID=2560256 RepID=A0A1Z1LZ90_9CAUD|nr:terminase small subunit [Serratia phage CHI14]YP_010092322.1 terminase small subunit [Serratia phage X20]ARW57867.1 terminase DNA packaging enzyme small subunit [Serratia phage CBH8]QYN80615.1 terminase [Kosakonia phage Kc304]ARW57592.1 terminase DNA packaging enzyme small subunit [Serratia phage CHI14]ARW58144.1 terminus DNA packaging enzyme, small subunit [Serratia phage X20]